MRSVAQTVKVWKDEQGKKLKRNSIHFSGLFPYSIGLRLLHDFSKVHDAALGVRILEKHSRNVLARKIDLKHISNFNLDPKW